MDDILEKLKAEADITSGQMIYPHHARGAVYFLKKPNDIVQVGRLIADDKHHLVKALLDAGEMYKLSEDDALKLKNDEELKYKFLIVQPFVLVQIS